uniref:CUB domain-containing protein n=1 Tax=Gongylonema pulchrum TaxID=637853 RepID=A0A183CVP8_9BILA
LQFKDGGDASHPVLGRYCNSKRPDGPIVSSGPKMVIQFHSNQSVNGKGFKIHYSAGMFCTFKEWMKCLVAG